MSSIQIRVRDVCQYMNHFAPFDVKLKYDNIGLLVGDPEQIIRRVIVTLDVNDAVADEAVHTNAGLLISHHAPVYKPLNSVTSDGESAVIYKLIRNGISLITCHTNLDITSGGVNDALAERLGLKNTKRFGFGENLMGLGRVGELQKEFSGSEFAEYIKKCIDAAAVRYYDSGKSIKTVAVIGGAGSSDIGDAYKTGAQAFVSADAKYGNFMTARYLGISLFDAGHYSTENVIVEPLCRRLRVIFPQLDIFPSDANTDVVKYC